MPTAYLSPSLLRSLSDVAIAPSAANSGYPLLWNNLAGKFQLSILPIHAGGTGSATGDIYAPGALTIAAGGNNQNIRITPSGNDGYAIIDNQFITLQKQGQNTVGSGFGIYKNPGFFLLRNVTVSPNGFVPYFDGQASENWSSLGFAGRAFSDNSSPYPGVVAFYALSTSQGNLPIGHRGFSFYTGPDNDRLALGIFGNRDCLFYSSTPSTSPTTGGAVFLGGVGVVGNLFVGGVLSFAGGTVPPTPTSPGSSGEIRYDGSYLYIATGTNTWRRSPLSTW